MVKFVHSPTNLAEIDTFHKAGVGYYRVRGIQVEIETFTTINGGQYGTELAQVDQDGNLVVISGGPDRRTQRKYDPPELCPRVLVLGMELEPDW